MQLAMDVCSRTGQVAAVPARYRFAVLHSLMIRVVLRFRHSNLDPIFIQTTHAYNYKHNEVPGS